MMKFPAPERKKPKLAFSANISGAMGRLQEKEVKKIIFLILSQSVFKGNGNAPTIKDEISVKDSEAECQHVSGVPQKNIFKDDNLC